MWQELDLNLPLVHLYHPCGGKNHQLTRGGCDPLFHCPGATFIDSDVRNEKIN